MPLRTTGYLELPWGTQAAATRRCLHNCEHGTHKRAYSAEAEAEAQVLLVTPNCKRRRDHVTYH